MCMQYSVHNFIDGGIPTMVMYRKLVETKVRQS